jgi:PAS domain S-box-containing protein
VRREAASTLRQSEERFRGLVTATSDVVYRMNPDWTEMRYLQGRGFMADTLEPSREWLVKYIPASDRPRVLEVIKQTVASRRPFELEHRVIRVDGTLGWTFSRAVPIPDGDGEVLEWFGAASDVTSRKQAETERERLLQETQEARLDAENANRMKDEFLATLSHELRTPLNAIVGWSKILRSGKIDADDVQEGVEVIERNARAQAQLIEDLLDVSRIISGKMTLDVQRVNLHDVIDAAIGSLELAAQAKDIRIHKILDSLAGPVAGDATRIQQVAWNLISNAIKFTPKGGKVQVLLERVNSHVEVSVVDNGVGIKPEFLPYVFERFRQAEGSTTRRHGGLGLGLAIVKQLVEMHGGSVRAKSPGEGQGATFTVSLPISIVHSERVPPRQQPAHRELTCEDGLLDGVRVLVVDDEADARHLIKRVLNECRAEVFLAGSASEALKIVENLKPDVLLSDIGMPETDGYDLIRVIRGKRNTKQLPAAALTAFARSEERRRALLAGFQTHVAKPVDPEELIAVVASLAGRTGMR